MTYAGLSELEAISAATHNAGLVLNLEGEIGAVAPGMLADVLVVDGDPSQDITILQNKSRIQTIILDGEIVDTDRSLRSWPNQPSYTYAGRYLTQEIARDAMNGHRPGRLLGDGTSNRADQCVACQRTDRQSNRGVIPMPSTRTDNIEMIRAACAA